MTRLTGTDMIENALGATSERLQSVRRRKDHVRWTIVTLVVALSCAFLLLGNVAWPVVLPTSSPTSTPHATTPRQSAKKVFAHYFPPYPISIDNKDPQHDYYAENYLNPDGEEGKHSSYGGLLRDRPLPRQPLSGEWRLTDLRTEVRQAKQAGIDGFTVDILSLSGSNWNTTLLLMRAASLEGDFDIIPNLDASSDVTDFPVDTLAEHLATLYSYSSAYRTADDAFILSTFKVEAEPVSWWENLMGALDSRVDAHIDLIGVFLDASETNMEKYAPICSMLSAWGARTPKGVDSSPNRAAIAHRLGVKWMAPVAVQDARPRDGTYAEAENTTLLRTMWNRAIDDRADWVQLVTWNDYSESTQFAPSKAHGISFLAVSRPYIDAFVGDTDPHFTDDTVVVTYRTQRADATARNAQNPMHPDLGGATTPPRNDVETVAMLQSPATITVSVGSSTHTFRADTGLSVHTVPLEAGAVSVSVVRDENVIADLAPPQRVKTTPNVLDLQYYAATNHDR